jgi:hypothetical protein
VIRNQSIPNHNVRRNAFIFKITNAENESDYECPLYGDWRCWQGKSGLWFIELTANELVDFTNQVGRFVMSPVDQKRHPNTTAAIHIIENS